MNARAVLILAVVVAAIVGAAAWFLQSQPVPALPAAMLATPTPLDNHTPGGPTQASPGPASPGSTPLSVPATASTEPDSSPRELHDWEVKIEQILSAQTNETDTAKLLLNLLPTLPPEGQVEAAQHISNLILDKDYKLLAPMLRNTGLASEVQDVLVTDVMNRSDAVKLPALLEVAKAPNHPYHDHALSALQIYLDQDNGSDWAKWDAGVKEFLRKQAADESAANPPAVP